MVLTILKNMSSSMERIIPYVVEKNVPNHQPAYFCSQSIFSSPISTFVQVMKGGSAELRDSDTAPPVPPGRGFTPQKGQHHHRINGSPPRLFPKNPSLVNIPNKARNAMLAMPCLPSAGKISSSFWG